MMNYTYPIASSGIGVMPKYKIVQKVVRTRETFTGSDTKELSEALADGWQVVMCHPIGECLEYIVQKTEVESNGQRNELLGHVCPFCGQAVMEDGDAREHCDCPDAGQWRAAKKNP